MERLSIAEKQLLVITLGAGVALVNERRKKRSIWTKKWLKRRALRGSYAMIFRELKAEDSNSFLKYLRMEPAIFNFILNKVAPFIKKQDTVLRESISAGARLEATLLWMAQGKYFVPDFNVIICIFQRKRYSNCKRFFTFTNKNIADIALICYVLE